jgi:hypothetical protein
VTNVHHPNRFAHRERIWYDYVCPHQKEKNDTNDVTTGYFFRKIIMIEDKHNHTIFFLCVQNGWDGGHWSPLRKVYGRNRDLVDRYGISVSQMTTDMFHKSLYFSKRLFL